MVNNANPNFPLVSWEVDFTTGPPNTPGGTRVSVNAGYRRLAVRSASIDRGRQYELDQVQAGTCAMQVVDPLEYLNPSNASSPLNSGANSITPYRCMWVWAMWPNQPGSGNIINPNVNNAYDPGFENSTGSNPALWGPAGGTTTCVVSTAQFFQGAKSMLVTQSAAGAGFGAANNFRTAPGIDYTMSLYVYPTGGATVQMQVTTASGVVRTSNAATIQNAWTRLTMSWTTVDTLEQVVVYGTVTATPTFYVDATMLEFGTTTNAFVTTGPTLYTLYTGYVERYPITYDMAGKRHIAPLTSVDALAILSRTVIAQSYYSTIVGDTPLAYIPFDNSTSMSTATIGLGMVGGQPYELPNSSNGSIQWAGDSNPDGTPAVTVNQRNPSNPLSSSGVVANNATVFEITGRSISLNTNGATVEMWARNSSGYNRFMMLTEGFDIPTITASGSFIDVETTGGYLVFKISDPATSSNIVNNVNTVNSAVSGYPDAQWHYYAMTFFGNGGGVALTVDGVENTYGNTLGLKNIGYNIILLDAYSGFGNPQSQLSVSRMGVYTRDIGVTSRNNHYKRGVGYINELSGARVTRLLNKYWLGSQSVAAGYLKMAPDFAYNNRTVLDVLQEIQESERGMVYSNTAGTVVFEDRTSRYQNQTSLWVLGENPVGASPVEYPYTDYAGDFDPTYTFTQANLGRPGNSNFAPVVNSVTQARYGQRILSQTLQCVDDFSLSQAATFYLGRYGSPKVRVTKMSLNPSANPSLWPLVLSLELSQRVTVKRRSDSLTTSNDYYIEHISHRIDAGAGTWTVDLQLTPVFVPSAWVMGNSTYSVMGSTTAPVY